MGSLGEEELEKLVIDYIEPPVIVSDHLKKPSKALITLQEILGDKDEEEKEIEEKIKEFIKKRRLSYEGDDGKKDVMKKIVSKLRSDGYDASLARTSWDSSFDQREGCRVFRHTVKYEYIDVMVTSDDDVNKLTKRVVIDLEFKSQFELAKPTRVYKDITEMLPRLYVAKEERLKRVVSLVCGEMKESMKEEGMHRPPWRTSRYMQAKWLSENRKRVSKKGSSCSLVFDVGVDGTMSGAAAATTGLKTKCCFSIF